MKERKRLHPNALRLQREQALILQTTDSIYEAMERKGVSKAELAQRMGKTPAYVTQILSGSRNLTLRTIADVALALEANPRVRID